MATESVFQNPLIVSHICSFASVDDLLNLRLTSRTLCQEATVYLRRRNATVKLDSDLSVNAFIRTMRSRMGGVIPFTSFSLNLHQLSQEGVWHLVAVIAQHVTCYKLSYKKNPNTGRNLAMLLANVPSLREIRIETHFDIDLTRRDVEVISPWMPNLRIIKISSLNRLRLATQLVELTSLLLSRSPQILYCEIAVKYSHSVNHHDLNCFRGLTPNQLPKFVSINNDEFEIKRRTLPLLEELIGMNLHFKRLKLGIEMYQLELDHQRLVSQLWEWLSLQADHLEKLDLTSWSIELSPPIRIRIPTLRALTDLNLYFNSSEADHFMDDENDEEELSRIYRDFNPILPFVKNQFPSLTELKLNGFTERCFAAFSEMPMPLVRKLTISYNEHYRGTLLFPDPWPLILPNLHSLHLYFDVCSGKDFGPLLSGILTHFAYVTELKLFISMNTCTTSFWDILTGGAPPVAQTGEALLEDLGPAVVEVPVAIDGVYEKPSLANLRNLKTLIFQPKHPENMDALVYMTRRNLLVPLEKLVVETCLMDIKVGYIDALAAYHGVVQVQEGNEEWTLDAYR